MNDSLTGRRGASRRSPGRSLSHGRMVHSPSSLRGAIGRLAREALSPLPPHAPLAAKGARTAVQCRHGRRYVLLLLLLDAGHFNLPARAGQCAEVTAAAPTLQGAAQAQQLVALLAPLPLAALHLQAALVALVRLCLLRKLAQLHPLRHRSMPMAGDRGPSTRLLCACRRRRRAGRAFLRCGHAADPPSPRRRVGEGERGHRGT